MHITFDRMRATARSACRSSTSSTTSSSSSTATRTRVTASAEGGAAASARTTSVRVANRASTAAGSTSTARPSQSEARATGAQPPRQQPAAAPQRVWKTAVDPKTGRTYYYDAVTRETQWRKPLELASEEERQAMARKEKKQKDFFAAMEANILKNMAAGSLVPPLVPSGSDDEERDNVGDLPARATGDSASAAAAAGPKAAAPPRRKEGLEGTASKKVCGGKAKPGLARPQMVRTISGMDDRVLAELTRVERQQSPGQDQRIDAEISVSGADELRKPELPYHLRRRVSPTSVADKENYGVRFVHDDEEGGDAVCVVYDGSPEGMSLRHPSSSAPSPSGGPSSPSASADDDSEEEEDRAIEEVRRVAETMSRMSVEGAGDSRCGPSRVGEGTAASSGGGSAKGGARKSKRSALAKPSLRKRNTCGTLYVGSTMSAPDKEATIKCICGVYRAHLLQSALEESSVGCGNRPVKFEEYEVFNDMRVSSQRGAVDVSYACSTPPRTAAPCDYGDSYSLSSSSADSSSPSQRSAAEPFPTLQDNDDVESVAACHALAIAAVPSLEELTGFYRDVFLKSQMESDCIIMSLIYIERLIKETNGGIRPRVRNWRSMLFSAMILSSKVWDDLSMWNADFSQCVTCPPGVTFSVQRINELERATLDCLNYNVKVAASEYAKYYFLLRSMLIRSGLGDGGDLTALSPLDVEGARQLELRSATCGLESPASQVGVDGAAGPSGAPSSGGSTPVHRNSFNRRAKSLGDAATLATLSDGGDSSGADDALVADAMVQDPEISRVSMISITSNVPVRANLEQIVQM